MRSEHLAEHLKGLGFALAAGAVLALAGTGSATAADPVRIPLHNWSSQIVGAHIVGKILNEAGYEVEYIPADSQVVYTSMCEGDIDLVHEVWQGAFGVAFEKVVAEGCVIDAQTHDATTREEWWYPAYVEELCPGLPDWKALDACAEMFSTPETSPKGRFLAGPVDWLKKDHERVEGLGMNFEVVNAGSASALWAELDAASKRNEPIVLFNWTPNFIEAIYDGKFVEFPEYAEGCREDPAWGMNPDLTHDCGNPKDGYLKIGVWKEFPENNPGAYEIVRQINFSNLDIAVMAKLADVDGMEPEEAADKWLADNESKWKAWLEGTGS
jgi:glycine betaine/proline transport system substrate-binding protein